MSCKAHATKHGRRQAAKGNGMPMSARMGSSSELADQQWAAAIAQVTTVQLQGKQAGGQGGRPAITRP